MAIVLFGVQLHSHFLFNIESIKYNLVIEGIVRCDQGDSPCEIVLLPSRVVLGKNSQG